MRDATLRQLRSVIAIAKSGKIVIAANRLGLTPPAVTEQLRLLERDLDLRLFDRTKSGLRPTDAGHIVLEAAMRIEALIQDTTEQLQSLKGLETGSITIGVVSTAKYFVPRLIHAFIQTVPSVEIRLLVGNREETIAALRDYEIDIAMMGRPPSDIVTSKACFGPHPYVLITRPDHPLASRKRVMDRSVLIGNKLLVREEGSGSRVTVEKFFKGTPLAHPSSIIEFGSNETIKQAVMAGLGIALISAHTIELEIEAGYLSILNIKDLPVVREWNLVHRLDKGLGPTATAFWTYALKDGAKHLPQVPGI
ncbi:LysR family transcriptional regulator [Hyphomicrobium methylovorum]|uniref:LysR substrate-binding domain-containing protein n=1 Tax=Hyphomicrobium methylovorum TaxID=84 RepID=UPI0015E7BDBE|nr:LysR substrate-binding domain-containing protein [Hyphomicrobium methylovorum]MBA2127432.1 LysR family transcriptional regulator [Hyphomicrobium methylovorum]